ncbi:MAG: hypothetical protein ACJ8FS_15865 [Sphingomicrobium sp.]
MLRNTAIALALLASPAWAGDQFSTYEGPDAVQAGTGGAKITKDGVDFWTDGTPPRKYQVLGFLTDSRHDKLLSGHAVGSSGLAKRVREAGGDALIVMGQDERNSGIVGGINGGFGWARSVHKITTKFAVVRYLSQ